jgi:hypothetical protein
LLEVAGGLDRRKRQLMTPARKQQARKVGILALEALFLLGIGLLGLLMLAM